MFGISLFVHILSLFAFSYGFYKIACLLEEASLLKKYIRSKEKGGFFLLKHPCSYFAFVARVFSVTTTGFKVSYFLPKKRLKGDSLISFVSSHQVESFSYKVCSKASISGTMVINTSSEVGNLKNWEELLSVDLNSQVKIRFFCENSAIGKG